MSNEVIKIKPTAFLDEKWEYDTSLLEYEYLVEYEFVTPSSGGAYYSPRRDLKLKKKPLTPEEKKLISWIKSTRIEIAEGADTRSIVKKRKFEYLKSEIGMNIVIPKGSIKEMRFYVELFANPEVIAIDGFPRDAISQKDIKGGKVKIAVGELFKFIPMFGGALAGSIKFELGPWEFKLGSLKKVNVDFSGGLTSKPEWYFKKNGIKNDLRVALTIKKPKETKYIMGKIKAGWLYDPGFFRKVRLETDTKTIKIF